MQMRMVHRVVTLFVVAFTLYLRVTGSMIQLIDLRSLFTHASPFDPNVKAMREAFAGPNDYAVLATADHVAPALPADANLPAMLATTIRGARVAEGAVPFRFVELRMGNGRPVGQVKADQKVMRFDAASGAVLGEAPPVPDDSRPDSQRNTFKGLHRMTGFGGWALWINIFVAIALATLIVTGTVMYVRLVRQRTKIRRRGLFWKAGGWWRALHRWTATVAAIFLVVVTLSGAWLAYESLAFGWYLASRMPGPGAGANGPAGPRAGSIGEAGRGRGINGQRGPGPSAQPGRNGAPGAGGPGPRGPRLDKATPLTDAALPGMLQTTLNAYHAAVPDLAVRAVRLRIYGGMPQGAVITTGEEARQLVFNAVTGKRVTTTEPGYPEVGFPFGWEAHQIAKSVHRGDYFGLTGRLMDLLAGLSMIYLSVSGIVLYYTMWKKRRSAGRGALIWK